ncbi:MAG: hypothetical protein ACOZNI_20785 [Myxococcota bacterium]
MSVREVLRDGDAAEAARDLVRRGLTDPREDPIVLDAVTGFVALQRRLREADEWIRWLAEARRGLERLVFECPVGALLQPSWFEETVAVGADAALLVRRLDGVHAAFAEAVPSDQTGGRPRRLVRNFVYTLDTLWDRDGRPRLTPAVLALIAKAVDPLVEGAIWSEAMANVGRLTNPTQPWADLLRAVRSVDPGSVCIETFTVRMIDPRPGGEPGT